MSFLPAVLAIGGTVISAAGQMAQASAQEDAAEFNAKVQEQQAERERQVADAEASDYRRQGSRQLASARAMRGATGVTGAGSPLLVDEATVREISLGSARLINRGDANANRLKQGAQLSRMEGKNAKTAGYLGAGSTLLGGIYNTGTDAGWWG